VAIPNGVLVKPSFHEAVTGFEMATRRPQPFEEAVDRLLTRHKPPDVVAHEHRARVLEEAFVALSRVGSPAAQAILATRLMSYLRLPASFGERREGFVESVEKFGGIDYSSASDMDATRSSHDRTRSKPPFASL
jgi:hypothetical protein